MQPSTLDAGIASRKDAGSESTTDPEASGKAAKMARAALFEELQRASWLLWHTSQCCSLW